MTAPSAYQRRIGRPADESLAVLALPLLALGAFVWLTSGEHGRGLVTAALGVVLLAVSAVNVRRFWREMPRTQPDDPGDEEEIILAAGGAL